MNKTRISAILLLCVVVSTVTACGVRGSGDLVSETRQVSNFDSIDLSGVGKVVITQDGSESLSIETDDNVMKHVETMVEDGTLKLGLKSGFAIVTPSQLVFNVGVDDLTNLTVSGSGSIESEMIETDLLDATVSGSGGVLITELTAGEVNTGISGSGEVNLAGEAETQVVTISGSGKYLAGELCSTSVKVSVSGSGDATVCATETLDSDISGSGSVGYYGEPSVNSSSSGSGRLNNLGQG